MPRSISAELKAELLQPQTGTLVLLFATITHPSLALPIRVVNDVKDYVYGGETFAGFPFSLTLLTDGEGPPTGAITIQNVDRRVGGTVLALRSPPRLKLEVLSSTDFDMDADPRVPLGTPVVEYEADWLYMRNIRADSTAIQAELSSLDPVSVPWPAIRSVKNRLPALYR